MAEAHVGSLPEGMKHCRVCAEPINVRATKCIHCNSDQGKWRQLGGLSSTVLALLIALFSVLTTAVPVMINALTPLDSRLVFSFPVADEARIALLVSNNGVRPGMLQDILLKSLNAGAVFLRPVTAAQHAAYIVEPTKSNLFEFARPKDGDWLGKTSLVKYRNCEITVSYVNFTGHRGTELFECPKGTKYFLNDLSLQ
jgi:hypothetical protein